MVRPFSWEKFKTDNENASDAFQTLAQRLFFCDLNIPSWSSSCPKTWPGIECDPIEVGRKYHSFQAKFYSTPSNGWSKLRDSLQMAVNQKKAGHFKLDVCHIFLNWDKPVKKIYKAEKSTGKQSYLETCEKIAHTGGFTLVWHFGDQIIERCMTDEAPEVRKIVRKFFTFPVQPHLHKPEPSSNPEGLSLYRFNERRLNFVGRQKEQEQLTQFIDAETEFSWWLLTGSALMGKSRLALEFGLSLPDEWEWGWVSVDTLSKFDFLNWKPQKNTFLVIDYAMGKEAEIERFMASMNAACASGALLNKVRLLILEREYLDWLRALDKIETIGSWVAGTKFRPEPLELTPLSFDNLNQPDGSDQANDDQNTLSPIKELLSKELTPADRQIRVREFLDRERKHRWNDATDQAREALVISTMCGGFNLNDVGNVSQETLLHLSDLNSSDMTSKMVGCKSEANTYPAIEPDIFGELMVLDHIEALNPLADGHKKLFRIAAEIRGGAGLVNFLYRCGQSFPNHKAMLRAIDDWATSADTKNIQRAVLANGIDLPILNGPDRMAKYEAVLRELEKPNSNLLAFERLVFLKILAAQPSSQIEVLPVELRIQQVSNVIVPAHGPYSKDILANLMPVEYCDAILSDWGRLNSSDKVQLTGPHLIELFHHLMLHKLSDRTSELSDTKMIFDSAFNALLAAHPNTYFLSVYIFQHLCANVVAGLTQFGRQTEAAMDLGDHIRGAAGQLITAKHLGVDVVIISSHLDRIDVGLTVLASQSRHRDYQYILERIRSIETRGAGIGPNDTAKMRDYVQAAVQAAHGFSDDSDVADYLVIFEKARKYTKQINNPETASAMGMILGQLARETDRFDLKVHPLDLLSEAINLAKQYPEERHDLVRHTIQELCTRYSNAVNGKNENDARRALELGLDLLSAVGHCQYVKNGGLWCGAFIEEGLKAFVEDGTWSLKDTQKVFDALSSSPIVAWPQIISAANCGGSYFGLAQRALSSGNIDKAERCLVVLKLCHEHMSESGTEQMIQIIEDKIKEA